MEWPDISFILPIGCHGQHGRCRALPVCGCSVHCTAQPPVLGLREDYHHPVSVGWLRRDPRPPDPSLDNGENLGRAATPHPHPRPASPTTQGPLVTSLPPPPGSRPQHPVWVRRASHLDGAHSGHHPPEAVNLPVHDISLILAVDWLVVWVWDFRVCSGVLLGKGNEQEGH